MSKKNAFSECRRFHYEVLPGGMSTGGFRPLFAEIMDLFCEFVKIVDFFFLNL